MNKIKILNLSFTDMGGAGKASLVFNEMFNNSGYESILVVKESNENNKSHTRRTYGSTYYKIKVG